MLEQGGSGGYQSFEAMSHAELLDIVNNTNPNTVLDVGNQLLFAGSQIQSLADDLHQNVTSLEWTGAAADSFRGWAKQIVQTTDTLANFTNTTAANIQMAGETLTTVKSAMPPLPTADMATVAQYQSQPPVLPVLKIHGQPVTSPSTAGQITADQAKAAQANIDSLHQEAIGLMEKLGGSYTTAYSTLGAATVPSFPPTPVALMPPRGSGRIDASGNVPNPGRSTLSSSTTSGEVIDGRSVPGTKKGSTTGSTQGGSHGGVTLVPVQPPVAGGGHSTGGGTTTLQGATPPSASPTAPRPGGGGTTSGGTGTGGTVTTGGGGASVPPHGVSTGIGGGEDSGGGEGRAKVPGSRGSSESPGTGGGGPSGGSSRSGAGSVTGEAAPVSEGGSVAGGSAVVPVGSRGRFGSSVIGDDVATGSGGTAVSESGVLGGGALGGGAEAAATGSSTARSGLAEEPTAVSGEAAAAPGGGGNAESMPMGMGAGMGRMGDSGRKRKGRRSGLLHEDAETWGSATPTANPAVIE